MKSFISLRSRTVHTLIIALIVFVAHTAQASELYFQSNTQLVHIGQEFALDVMLDPQGQNINALGLHVTFPDNFIFVKAIDGTSVIPVWLERAHLSDGSVALSGIIPGGFAGLIDPQNPKESHAGQIVRLIFRATTSGSGLFSIAEPEVLANDGSATATKVVVTAFPVRADTRNVSGQYAVIDARAPLDFTPIIVSDKNLFDGHLAVVFDAQDEDSGVDYFAVKEDLLPWRKAASPYKLRQPFIAFGVSVKAVDHAGNQTIGHVRLPLKIRLRSYIIIGIIAISIAYAIIRIIAKRHA